MNNLKFSTLLCILALACVSCGTVKYVPQIQHDTTVVYKNNNIYQHDSIYVYKDKNIYMKGDTVFVNTVEFKDRWKIKEVHDTSYVDKVKTEIVTEYVEKELTKAQKNLIWLGKLSVFLIAGLFVLLGIKLYKKVTL